MTFVLAEGPLADVFVGRKAELAQLADVLARVRQGQPWLVTIEGESGVGKTALARHSLASSTGLTSLWARADPSETDLEYGIIDQLLRGVDRRVLARYPLLAGDVVKSSPFAVGAQLLGIIGDQQGAGPVALVIDDVQWADRRSVEALSFTFRRLSVDAVAVILIVRGDRDQLDGPARRMLLSVAQRRRIFLPGLSVDDVAPLAAAVGAGSLGSDAIRRLYDRTGGHTLYLRTVLSDTEGLERLGRETAAAPVSPTAVPASLAAAIGDQLAALPAPTRSLLEMLAVVNGQVPLALLGGAAGVEEPSAAIGPAVRAGLADLSPDEPTRPVVIRHGLQRDAIYVGMTADRRRELHARAVAPGGPRRPRPAWTTGRNGFTRRWPGPWCVRPQRTTWAWPAHSGTGGTMRCWTAAAGCTRYCGGRCWSRAWRAQASWSRRLRSWSGCRTRTVGSATCNRPWPGWRDGWRSSGHPDQAREIYQRGEDTASTQSPVYTARSLLAHGQLLRRTGQRRLAVERLRRAEDLYRALRAAPFIARTEEELTACGLRREHAKRRSVLEMTDREAEVAHLIEHGMTNAEIAAELFITPKAVEYHLGNIYAKFGLKGRQQLRRLLADSRRP